MNHVAIDLGGKDSQICIRHPDGAIVEERKVPTRKLTELVSPWPASRVVMETSAEAFRIADAAIAAGHQVRVVPGSLVRLLGVGDRGVKNDQRDAQQLSRASWQTDVPSVHIPSKLSRELKSICGARDVIVGTRTKLINNVRGWMRTQLWKVRGGTTQTFADRVRGHAAAVGEPLPEHIERQLRMLSAVIEETKAAGKQLQTLAAEHAVCRRLMTVPGVGPLTAVRFVATIDEPGRFSSAHRVQSYLGLTPGDHSSSERERRTGITKAGPMELRCTLIQAAWAAMCRVRTSHPMIDWAATGAIAQLPPDQARLYFDVIMPPCRRRSGGSSPRRCTHHSDALIAAPCHRTAYPHRVAAPLASSIPVEAIPPRWRAPGPGRYHAGPGRSIAARRVIRG